MCFPCSFHEYKAKQETNVAAPSNQPLENCISYPTCTRYSHTEGYGRKAHSTNSEDGNTIALSGKSCTKAVFSPSSEFGYFQA